MYHELQFIFKWYGVIDTLQIKRMFDRYLEIHK